MTTPKPESRGGSALPKIAVVMAIVVLLLFFVVCGGIFAVFGTVVGVGWWGSTSPAQQANVEATRLRIMEVEQSLHLYALTHDGQYPTTSEGLEEMKRNGWGSVDTVYIDAWGHKLQYFHPGSHEYRVEIVSLGRDGQTGGEGFDADIYSWDNP